MAAKKKTLADEGGTAVLEVPTVHGTELSFGDTKSGGSVKKPLVAVLPRKSIHVTKGFNPRTHLGDIDALSESIKKDGLLSSLVVRPQPKNPGHFDLVAGEKRLKACDDVGLDEIPCTIRTDLVGDDDRARAVAVAENSEDGRTNLNAIEIGRVAEELSEKGWTVNRIASECALHPMKVRRCLTLIQAPEDIQKKVEKNELSAGTALEFAKLDDETRKAIKNAITADTSAAELKKLAKAAAKELGGTGDNTPAQKKKGKDRTASLYTWQGSKAKQAKISELAYYVVNAEGKDKGSSDWYELRGSLAALLWDRGDLTDIFLPEEGSDAPKAKKTFKAFDEAVAAEAAKFTPPDGGKKENEVEAEKETAGSKA